LGRQDPFRAKIASHCTIIIDFTVACFIGTGYFILRDYLPLLYSSDTDVCTLTSEVLAVVAIYQGSDALTGAIQAVFRGTGKPIKGVILNFSGLYMVGLPVALLLGFKAGLGITGFWWGLTIGNYTAVAVGSYLLSRNDWIVLAEEARVRILGRKAAREQRIKERQMEEKKLLDNRELV